MRQAVHRLGARGTEVVRKDPGQVDQDGLAGEEQRRIETGDSVTDQRVVSTSHCGIESG